MYNAWFEINPKATDPKNRKYTKQETLTCHREMAGSDEINSNLEKKITTEKLEGFETIPLSTNSYPLYKLITENMFLEN